MEIISYKKNCLGTMSFVVKFVGMRKEDEFTVYPISQRCTKIIFQSNHRWAELDITKREFEISASRQNYADNAWFQICKIKGKTKKDKCSDAQFKTIIEEIAKTNSKASVENTLKITCDNSYADKITN